MKKLLTKLDKKLKTNFFMKVYNWLNSHSLIVKIVLSVIIIIPLVILIVFFFLKDNTWNHIPWVNNGNNDNNTNNPYSGEANPSMTDNMEQEEVNAINKKLEEIKNDISR